MLTVRWRAFGPLRGTGEDPATGTWSVPEGTTLREALALAGWADRVRRDRIAVAVNGTIEPHDARLDGGDEVDLLPPVSGG